MVGSRCGFGSLVKALDQLIRWNRPASSTGRAAGGTHVSLAQLAEQWAFNPTVPSSSLGRNTLILICYNYCMANSNEYMREYMLRRYRKRRADALVYLGELCAVPDCGETGKLEIDHINPEQKKYEMRDLWCGPLDRLYEELDKCQLLCHLHHVDKSVTETIARKKTRPKTWTRHGNCKHDSSTTARRRCRKQSRLEKG